MKNILDPLRKLFPRLLMVWLLFITFYNYFAFEKQPDNVHLLIIILLAIHLKELKHEN